MERLFWIPGGPFAAAGGVQPRVVVKTEVEVGMPSRNDPERTQYINTLSLAQWNQFHSSAFQKSGKHLCHFKC